MNKRDIEEAIRISKELQNNKTINQEITNAKRINDNLAAYKKISKIDSESIIEIRRRDYLRGEKGISSINNNYLKITSQIDHIKREFLRDKNESGLIRKDYLSALPKWQERILPALSIRPSEVKEILNNRNAINERLDFIPNNFRKQEFWNEIDNLRNTYVGNLAISMRDAVETSASNEEVLGKIESLFEEKVGLLPQNQFSREFVINLFLSVLITIIQLWYSHYLSEQSSVELNSLFRETFYRLEKIENKFENFNLDDESMEDDEIYYLVQRTTSVHNRPNFNSLAVDYLSSKTKVRLIKTKHKWIYIEYIDYLEVIPRYGWVNKKYLKKIDK